MAQAKSKWHHYVSQGILSGFCYSGTKLWYYSKRRSNEGVASRDIVKKFRKRHYYSMELKNGIRSDVLEREFFQVLDSRISEFTKEFRRVIGSGSKPIIDTGTKNFLRQFIYYQTKRNPDFEKTLGISLDPRFHVEKAIEKYEHKFGKVEIERKQKMLSDEEVSATYEYARTRSLARQSPLVTDRLSRMSCHFAFPPENKQFIIGSNPVVRLENKPGGELGDGTVEIWTPLSPKILLGFTGPGSSFEEFLDIPDTEVRKVNLQLFKQSAEVGSASEKLLKSIVDARP